MSCRKQKSILEKEKKQAAANYEKLEGFEKQLRSSLVELQAKNNELSIAHSELEKQNNELRTQIGSLQQELDNSETVQKDFVQLSQSLQVKQCYVGPRKIVIFSILDTVRKNPRRRRSS